MMTEIQAIPTHDVIVQLGATTLEGSLTIPDNPKGLVMFVHGSGSSRFSSRNRYVADVLNKGGLGTLLFDLLTPEEHEIDIITRELRFDIVLLSERTIGALDWLADQKVASDLRVGLFGASTGAAAALNAAAARSQQVAAVVSRGGRPDLAMGALPDVQAPTLLIVGGWDEPVIKMNREASEALRAPWHMEIVESATHLFEEPGKLEVVAALARDWFLKHLQTKVTDTRSLDEPVGT